MLRGEFVKMRARNSDADILFSALDLEGIGSCVPFDPAAIFPRNTTERINLMIPLSSCGNRAHGRLARSH